MGSGESSGARQAVWLACALLALTACGESEDADLSSVSAEARHHILQLRHGSKEDRIASAKRLGELHPVFPLVITELLQTMKDEDYMVYRQAIVSLAIIAQQDDTVVPGLIEMLNERRWRTKAVMALERIGPRAAPAVPVLRAKAADILLPEYFRNQARDAANKITGN